MKQLTIRIPSEEWKEMKDAVDDQYSPFLPRSDQDNCAFLMRAGLTAIKDGYVKSIVKDSPLSKRRKIEILQEEISKLKGKS